MNDKELMTYEDLANYLSLKRDTLYKYVKNNKIPYVRLGPHVIRFRRQEIDSWIMNKNKKFAQYVD